MNCPHCQTNLIRDGRDGAQMVKTNGLLFKAGQLALICPSCKQDMPASPDMMKALQVIAGLFFKGSAPLP